ncbi:flagellar hook-associated protein FlgL [Sessilibacter corallicola]|uniref:Flagellar hook-associated protein FlgL n=1 Tax=Sessilibacter corallicola TaxID=2904075 RepID=A0ABQ0AE27_9GAMM
MRISTTQAFTGGVNSIQDIYAELLRTQEQISTGKEVLSPSDDPVAATRILNLQEDNALLSRFRSNITLASNSLFEQEALLNSTLIAVQRLEELTIQAGDGALSNVDRVAIGLETQQIYEQLVDIANSQNARGEFLFAGSQAQQQPFLVQPDGSVNYAGDENVRAVEIAGGSFVSIRDSGHEIFQNIDNTQRVVTSSSNEAIARIGAGALVDDDAFDNYFDLYAALPAPQTTTLTLTDNRDATDPNFPNVPLNYSLEYSPPDGSGPIAITNFNLVNENSVDSDGFLEIQVDLSAEFGQTFSLYLPTDENGFVVGAGDPDGAGATVGEQTQFFIERQETQGLLNTAFELTQLLNAPADESSANQNLSDRLGRILSNLDSAGRNIDNVSASIGARLNLLESTDTLHEDSELFNAEALSTIEDLDFVRALSDLSLQQTVLEAAQASYVQVTRLSLFDRL